MFGISVQTPMYKTTLGCLNSDNIFTSLFKSIKICFLIFLDCESLSLNENPCVFNLLMATSVPHNVPWCTTP